MLVVQGTARVYAPCLRRSSNGRQSHPPKATERTPLTRQPLTNEGTMRTIHQRLLTALAASALLVPNAHAVETGNESGVAVIIGNKEYQDQDVPDVDYAHNDADAFREFVVGSRGFSLDNVVDLRDATKVQMEGAFEEGRDDDEGPLRKVEFAVPFAMGVYEVTVGEFRRFVQASGSSAGESCAEGGQLVEGRSWRDPGFRQDDSHPVVCVSRDDAQAYVRWLSAKTGKRYRLPSESEWEYAARAGMQNSRPWGDDDSGQCGHANSVDGDFERSFADSSKEPCADSYARCGFYQVLRRLAREAAQCDDGHAHTAPVGRYEANKWGLHDVLGNVVEWTEDCWNDSYAGAPRDGSAWRTGRCHRTALRGGGWAFASGDQGQPRAFGLRFADRIEIEHDAPMNFVGFRVARALAP